MVRTRSDTCGVRIGSKASFKSPASSSGGSSGKSGKKGGGSGNRYCPRETPPWQKEITKFFNSNTGAGPSSSSTDEGVANSSTSLSKE